MSDKNPKSTRGRVAVVVLGPPRSGAGPLTRILNLVGCDLPATLTGDNEGIRWQSRPIRALNERVLESAGLSWSDLTPLGARYFDSPKAAQYHDEAADSLVAEYGASGLLVLHDPSVARLLPLWRGVLEEGGFRVVPILALRNPLDVAASLAAAGSADPALGLLLWLRYMLDAEAASRGHRRVTIEFGDLVDNWAVALDRAQNGTGINWPRYSSRSAQDVNAFLDRQRPHRAFSDEAVISDPMLSTWVREAFAILRHWSRGQEHDGDRAALDRIRREFDAAAPAFGGLVSSLSSQRQAGAAREAALSRTLAEAQQEATALRNDLGDARSLAGAQIDALHKSLEEATDQRRLLDQQAAGLRERLGKSEAGQREMEARVAERVGELRRTIEASERALKTAEDEAARRIGALEADLAAEHKARAEVEARAETDLNNASKRITDLESKRRELEARLADERQAAEELRAQAGRGQARQAELEAQLAEQLARAEALATETAALKDRQSELETRLAAEVDRFGALDERRQELQSELDDREASLADLRAELAGVVARQAEVETRMAEERTRAEGFRAEAEAQSQAAQAASTALHDLEGRLARTESALNQRQLEAEQTAEALAKAQSDLQAATEADAEREKIVSGLKEHVNFLLADLKTRPADGGAEGKAALEKQIKDLGNRLADRYREIETLTRLLADKEDTSVADAKVDAMRLAAAKQVGAAVAGLLDSGLWRFVPGRLRVRRQMALLQKSGLFDAEWYLKHYTDVAAAGIDPLKHYVVHGAREGREPNGLFASLKDGTAART